MAGKQARQWKIDEIIALGISLIGETISEMQNVLPENRDNDFAKALSSFMRAAVEISHDAREEAAFMSKQELDPDMMRGLIQDYLRAMPREEFVQMVAQVRTEQQQEGARV